MFVSEPSVLVAFVLASLALNLTPGLDMVYVAGTTVQWRARAGVHAALGIALGSLCHATLAAAGLSVLVVASPTAMTVVTLAGAGYLVWSGLRMMGDASPPALAEGASPAPTGDGSRTEPRAAPSATQAPTAARIVLRGALVNLLNVKVILFYLSFIPQFIRPGAGPTWEQAAFYGLVFNLLGTSVLMLVALLGGLASRTVLASPRAVLVVRRTCGATLVVLAIALTVSQFVAR
jgi:threonine/homoserine/homoserine lactone efflux protein